MTVVCCQETSQHKAQQGIDMQPHCGEAGRSTSPDRGIQGWIESYGWGWGGRSVVNEGTSEAGGVGGHFGNGEEVDKRGPQACKIVQ